MFFFLLEQRGVEPRSKDPSTSVSSIIEYYLIFPFQYANIRAYQISSFMNLPSPQSFGEEVLRLFDARNQCSELQWADSCHIRQRMLNYYLQRLNFSRF